MCLLLSVSTFKSYHQRQEVQTRLSEGAVASPPSRRPAGAELQHHPRTCAWQDSREKGSSGLGPWICALSSLFPALGSALVLVRMLWPGLLVLRALWDQKVGMHMSWEGCCSQLPHPAAFRGSRALPGGRGSRAEPAGSTAFHPRRLPEGFPASGTQSDDFFPPFFCFLLVVLQMCCIYKQGNPHCCAFHNCQHRGLLLSNVTSGFCL